MNENEHRIVRVEFGRNPMGVPYLCDDESIELKEGDSVIVEDAISSKKILGIDIVTDGNSPFEISRLKKVKAKVNPEDGFMSKEPVRSVKLSKMEADYPFLTRILPPENEVLGRDEEINILVESMYKKRMKNTVLVGPAGCGKTAIIEAFAEKIADKYLVYELNQGMMIAGTRYRGDYEEKITNAIETVIRYNQQNEKKIILFIDEIHTIVSAGADDSLSAGDIIKTYLSKGQIMVIGATTNHEFEAYLAHDTALCRRLAPVYVKELTDEVVLGILDQFAEGKVDPYFLSYILNKSKTLPVHSMPDTPIEILDRCMAKRDYHHVDIDEDMIDQILVDLGA